MSTREVPDEDVPLSDAMRAFMVERSTDLLDGTVKLDPTEDTADEVFASLRQYADLYLRLHHEREVMAAALRALEQWDMLTLTTDGRGVATADAPWARALIADALSGRTGDES